VNVVLNREPHAVSRLRAYDSTLFVPLATQRPDSLLFVVPDTILSKNDTLRTIFEYTALDSLENRTVFYDTISFTIDPKKIFEEDTLVTVNTNIVSGALERKQPLVLTFNHPVAHIDYAKIRFISVDDTIRKEQTFKLSFDSTRTIGTFSFSFQSDLKYELIIDSLAISDMYGQFSMPQTFKFRVPDESEYGVLAINIIGDLEPQTIFELFDKSKKVIWQGVYPDSKNLTVRTLKPGAYTLRLFVDLNRNKKWDTGDYYKGIQPEFVMPYSKEITIRANWDTEITWKIDNK
jgi:hypothetical protein